MSKVQPPVGFWDPLGLSVSGNLSVSWAIFWGWIMGSTKVGSLDLMLFSGYLGMFDLNISVASRDFKS